MLLQVLAQRDPWDESDALKPAARTRFSHADLRLSPGKATPRVEGPTRSTVHHARVTTCRGLDWPTSRSFIGATPCILRIKFSRFPGSISLFLIIPLSLLREERAANMFQLSRTVAVASLVSLLGHCSLATAQPTSTDGELRAPTSQCLY